MKTSRVVVEVSSTVRRLAISPRKVRELVEITLRGEKIRDAMVSVTFVGRATMARMNGEYLRHDSPTDVISFGMGRDLQGAPAMGDIYICPDVAGQNARRAGVSISNELARLVVHGTLHVAGHDHPADETRMQSVMWQKQERIVARGS